MANSSGLHAGALRGCSRALAAAGALAAAAGALAAGALAAGALAAGALAAAGAAEAVFFSTTSSSDEG
jgi:hypothetical protein